MTYEQKLVQDVVDGVEGFLKQLRDNRIPAVKKTQIIRFEPAKFVWAYDKEDQR